MSDSKKKTVKAGAKTPAQQSNIKSKAGAKIRSKSGHTLEQRQKEKAQKMWKNAKTQQGINPDPLSRFMNYLGNLRGPHPQVYNKILENGKK